MLTRSTALRRRLQIADWVRQHGEASVEDLSQMLGVSSVTIRGDLSYLEQQGYLVRAFGKALRHPPAFHHRKESSSLAVADRIVLFRQIVAHVQSDQTISILASDITRQLLPFLGAVSHLTLILQDPTTIEICRTFLDSQIRFCGGQFNPQLVGVVGASAEHAVCAIPVDLCILAVTNISEIGELFVNDAEHARVCQQALQHARQTIVIGLEMDGQQGHRIGSLTEIDYVMLASDSYFYCKNWLNQHHFHCSTSAQTLIQRSAEFTFVELENRNAIAKNQ